jgi:hypothetical protein
MSEKLPEWPVITDDELKDPWVASNYYLNQGDAALARLRVAVEALDDILCLADIYSEKQTKIATAALREIGEVPK